MLTKVVTHTALLNTPIIPAFFAQVFKIKAHLVYFHRRPTTCVEKSKIVFELWVGGRGGGGGRGGAGAGVGMAWSACLPEPSPLTGMFM